MDGATKTYVSRAEETHALASISLEIPQGQFFALLGPSGCGKSTLLMLIAGLIPATSGSIHIGERHVQAPYTNLGMVFQRDLLMEWKTVIDNVLVQASFRGLQVDQYRDRARDLLTQVGLEGFEERYPWELSGGMRQRVSICRALLLNPPLLLMDEPFGALDALTREQLNLDLQRIWQSDRKTVVFVTHSIAEAVFLADRIAIMSPRPGRIVDLLPIDMARPRRLDLRESLQFGEYIFRIRKHFKAMGLLRDE